MSIETKLLCLEKAHQIRSLRPIEARENGRIKVKDKWCWDFSSNDYLGLAQDAELKKASMSVLEDYGMGATGSRLLGGDYRECHELETALAVFKGMASALVFNSGYQANIGVMPAIVGKNDVVFADKLIHASLIDGIQLSGATLIRYKHQDLVHLKHLLEQKRTRYQKAILLTESVFSMDGDISRLTEMAILKEEYDALLVVDEAHATGLFGERGSGQIEAQGMSHNVDVCIGTFGKALGGFGAYVACSEILKRYLITACRSFIYTTALPLPVVAWNRASIQRVQQLKARANELLENATYCRQRLTQKGLCVLGESQIIPIVLGDTQRTLEIAETLQEAGFWVSAIRPPTVPKSQARLRLSLTPYLSRACLESCLDVLDNAL